MVFTVQNSEIVKFHWYFCAIFTLLYVTWLRIWVLTFIHVLDDGSAEPKHVVYWHNLRTNDVACKIYIYCSVSGCVYCHCIYLRSVTTESELIVFSKAPLLSSQGQKCKGFVIYLQMFALFFSRLSVTKQILSIDNCLLAVSPTVFHLHKTMSNWLGSIDCVHIHLNLRNVKSNDICVFTFKKL
jgi:hypothetical protein